jgi:hypothetical protein
MLTNFLVWGFIFASQSKLGILQVFQRGNKGAKIQREVRDRSFPNERITDAS